MNKEIFDLIDELAKPEHHWTWYQTNGKTAMENYAIQKAQLDKELLAKKLKNLLLEEEAKRSEEIADFQLIIKSEVK